MNILDVKRHINAGDFRDRFIEIYMDEKKADLQKDRYFEAVDRFVKLFGEGDICIFSAPGRSEVLGNHTDHQHGQILAASINLDAIAITEKIDTEEVIVASGNEEAIHVDLSDLSLREEEKGTTLSLIKGVLVGAKERGYKIGGFRCYITSDVLIGAGLSSSACFEVLLGTIISNLYNEGKLDPVTNAIIGQYAENVYFGKPCGLMDQMACSVGSLVHVDFADPKNPVVEKVDFDMNKYGYSLCITDTKGSHADLTPDYAAVPAEMKAVAACFGQEVLLGITMEQILEKMSEIREKCGDRAVLRAIHFIHENERVEMAVEALKKEDTALFLKNVKASGNSSYKLLQNVYSNSHVKTQNVAIALAVAEDILEENYGVCRVHGGGFAGTMQAFVKNERVTAYAKAMDHIFGEKACDVLKIRKYGGIQVL